VPDRPQEDLSEDFSDEDPAAAAAGLSPDPALWAAASSRSDVTNERSVLSAVLDLEKEDPVSAADPLGRPVFCICAVGLTQVAMCPRGERICITTMEMERCVCARLREFIGICSGCRTLP
jgi:hypothetical protein